MQSIRNNRAPAPPTKADFVIWSWDSWDTVKCSWPYVITSFIHLCDDNNACRKFQMGTFGKSTPSSKQISSELLKLTSWLKQTFRFHHFLWLNRELRKTPVLQREHMNCSPTWPGYMSNADERWNAYRKLLSPVWEWSRWRSRTPRAPSSCSSEPHGASGACCSPGDLQ